MPELTDKNFKATIIKCFNDQFNQHFAQMKKSLRKEIEDIKNQIELLELNNIITEVKKLSG